MAGHNCLNSSQGIHALSGFTNTAHMWSIDTPTNTNKLSRYNKRKAHTQPADSLSDSLDLNFLISELGLTPGVLCMLGMYSAVELHTILAMAVVLHSDAVPTMCHER